MGPKSERVYRTIREWIATGKYSPGSKLPSERTLSEELEIGRTALRQVLAKLVAEGVVEVHGRSSYRVPREVAEDATDRTAHPDSARSLADGPERGQAA
jgi:DNA-binding FadR family transcriptional regulator